jgi:hypothetical protein
MKAQAEAHKIRYLRFKADESAQAITGPYRQKNLEDNNERQAIHEHVSVALNAPKSSSYGKTAAGVKDPAETKSMTKTSTASAASGRD